MSIQEFVATKGADVVCKWIKPGPRENYISIIPWHGVPVYVLPGITTYDCHFGPVTHGKRDERLKAERLAAANVSIYFKWI